MTSQSGLYHLRRDLKITIYHQRRNFAQPSTCPICGKEITIKGGADMHEAFFTRGDVQGIKDENIHHLIYHPCNVVLVHHGDCHLTAQHAPEGKRKCAEMILKWEGAPNVRQYIDQMARVVKHKLDAIQLLGYIDGLSAQLPKTRPAEEPTPRWDFD